MKFAADLPHQLQVNGNYNVIEALRFANTYDYDRDDGRFVPRENPTDFGYHVIELGQRLELGDTTITAVHANHSIDKINHFIMSDMCLNYVFERGGKTRFYGLDSSYPFPHTVDFLRRFRMDAAVDVVITIGDRALNECPSLSGELRHWAIPDPADADGTPDSEMEAISPADMTLAETGVDSNRVELD